MGRNFWPVFTIVASLSLAAVWRYSPAWGAKLSAETRRTICRIVAACMFREPPPALEDEKRAANGTPGPAVAQSEENLPSDLVRSPEGWDKDTTPVRPIAPPKKARVEVKKENAETPSEDLPSLRGVVQADPGTAAWGVLNCETEVEGLDGESMGRIAGGRFFVIASRTRNERGLRLIGNFTPVSLDEEVSLPAENIYCFTGSPDLLTKRQQHCLRMYYQLTGEAKALKAKLMVEAAKKSPYFSKAAEAVRAFQERARQVEKIRDATGEAARAAAYELSGLKEKALEMNRKHKEWKEMHAFEMPDPEKDPAYLKILEKRRSYADPIAGMAY